MRQAWSCSGVSGERKRGTPGRGRFVARVEPLESRQLLSTIYVDVHNTSGIQDGSSAHPYQQIENAIEHATTQANVIKIAAGTYAENLVVDHPVQLLGPNANVNPNTNQRAPEAVIVPPTDNPVSGVNILIAASNVTINGLTVDGHSAALGGSVVLNGVSVSAKSGISNVASTGVQEAISNLTVQDDIIQNFTGFGVIGDANDYVGPPYISTGNVIKANKIDNVPVVDVAPIGTSQQGRGISIEDDFYATVSSNVLTRCATGIQSIYELDPNPLGGTTTIAGNQVQAYDRGILVYTADTDTAAETVSSNTITAVPGGATVTSVGLDVNQVLDTTTVAIASNSASGFQVGLQLSEPANAGGVTVSKGTLSGNAIGVLITNNNPDVPHATTTRLPVAATLSGVTISNNTQDGIAIVDANNSVSTPVTLTTASGTRVTGSPHGVTLTGAGAAVVETSAPTVKFTKTPGSTTRSTTAVFEFTDSDPVSSTNDLLVQYQLDGGALFPATSPLTLNALGRGSHTLTVFVTDQGGRVSKVAFTWTIL